MGNKVKKTFMKKFNAHGYIDENGEQCFEWCERPVDVLIDKDRENEKGIYQKLLG